MQREIHHPCAGGESEHSKSQARFPLPQLYFLGSLGPPVPMRPQAGNSTMPSTLKSHAFS